MKNYCTFSCYYDEEKKKDTFYKGTFWRKKVTEEDFYGASRKYLAEQGRYKIIPILENAILDPLTYLEKKAILSRRNNWESDFGKRMFVKAEFVEDNNYKRAQTDSTYIPYYLYLNVWICDEKTKESAFDGYFTIKILYSHENYEFWNYSAEYIALLIRNAINGNLQTARDIEETCQKRVLDIYQYEESNIYQCEECNEKFTNLNDFFCHLLEENHYDSILDEFPNDKEILHVKKMIEKAKSQENN